MSDEAPPTATSPIFYARVARGTNGMKHEIVMLGITRDSFEEMVAINSLHTIDLTSVGFPVKIAVFGAETLEAAQNKVPRVFAEQQVKPKLVIPGKLVGSKFT